MKSKNKNIFLRAISSAGKAAFVCFIAYFIVCLVNNAGKDKE